MQQGVPESFSERGEAHPRPTQENGPAVREGREYCARFERYLQGAQGEPERSKLETERPWKTWATAVFADMLAVPHTLLERAQPELMQIQDLKVHSMWQKRTYQS